MLITELVVGSVQCRVDSPLTIVSSDKSSLISSVRAIGATPSGTRSNFFALLFSLFPLLVLVVELTDVVETFLLFLVLTNGECVGEHSGVDFLSGKTKQKNNHFEVRLFVLVLCM